MRLTLGSTVTTADGLAAPRKSGEAGDKDKGRAYCCGGLWSESWKFEWPESEIEGRVVEGLGREKRDDGLEASQQRAQGSLKQTTLKQ